jgi:hypothetical protein
VSRFVGADVAYTVEIERFKAKVGGQREKSDIALRVTCVIALSPSPGSWYTVTPIRESRDGQPNPLVKD